MSSKVMQRSLYGFLQITGVIAAVRWFRRNQLTAVCLHGVVSDEGGVGVAPTRWQLRASDLDRQISILKKKYRFVSLDEIEDVLRNGNGGGKPCCFVTLDDGYSSAWKVAWPILKKHGVPGVVFVATEHMAAGKLFWWDRLDYTMMHMPKSIRSVTVGGHNIPVTLDSRKARAASARFVTQHSRGLFEHEQARFKALEAFIQEYEREEWLEDLKSWVGVMTSDDVAEASDSGFEIGSHTVHHYRLGDLDREAARKELRESKAAIEHVTKKTCRSFCYPEGSLNDISRDEVESAGYEFAFCSEAGFNGPDSDRLALRRWHLPNGGSSAYVLARVSGVEHAVLKIRTLLTGGRK
ncbi:MAG: polysaccharide deacetylase family protein [Gammaproteobacteria bacterium]|nr:polysaccharide deacetylase family protein [Gammaproteobacteria bacterium]MDH5260682.1 polysaccharide deacetylase family protein [Gammaproteobacteria bacterium]